MESSIVRTTYHLTDTHLKPDSFQKQSVKLAFQALSGRTAACIYTALALNCFSDADKGTAEETANFISKINEITDILNSISRYSANPNKCAISEEKVHLIEKLKVFMTEIETWKRPYNKIIDVRKPIEPNILLLDILTKIPWRISSQ